MKKPFVPIIAVLIISIAGVGIFTLSKNSQTAPTPSIKQKSGAMMDTTESSRYKEYSKAVLDESKDTKRILYFYANWCPTCRPADKNFKENSAKIPEDVTLIRVNYHDPDTDQEEKELANKYAVTYQHTFVQIDPSGNQITQWNGGQIDELLAKLK